jgi:hypothetical protein
MNAVATHQAGIASGINNAVASLANLLAVAIIGAAALGAYNHALDRQLASGAMSVEVRRAVEAARGNFVAAVDASLQGQNRSAAEAAIKSGLAEAIGLALSIAAALAAAGAACSALTIGPKGARASDQSDRERETQAAG